MSRSVTDTQARLDAARTALRCLRLEVPASVHDDVVAKIEPLLAELERVTAALRYIREQGDAWSAEIADQALVASGARAAQEDA
jgi:hypothetical protein